MWGVFKMAFYVASETGRTMNADKAAVPGGSGGSEAAAGDTKAASPLEPRRPLHLLQGAPTLQTTACSRNLCLPACQLLQPAACPA